MLATGRAHIGRSVPVMLRRDDGDLSERFVHFVYQPLTDSSGNRVGIVVHGSDVTENVIVQREIERLWRESETSRGAVQESEGRYRFLANAIPVQVWTATPEGALDYVSDRTAAYFGKSPEELIGEQWLGVLHADDVSAALARWKESLTTGADYEMEFRLWSETHQCYRWHLARATAQCDEFGRIIRWFGTNTDIEESKQAESELMRLTAEATEASHAKSAFLGRARPDHRGAAPGPAQDPAQQEPPRHARERCAELRQVGLGDTRLSHSRRERAVDPRVGPAEHQERIFEPFVQSKRAITKTDQGVGLGLAISRQLARAMQADLTVSSVVDEGSTFTLTLPRAA